MKNKITGIIIVLFILMSALLVSCDREEKFEILSDTESLTAVTDTEPEDTAGDAVVTDNSAETDTDGDGFVLDTNPGEGDEVSFNKNKN